MGEKNAKYRERLRSFSVVQTVLIIVMAAAGFVIFRTAGDTGAEVMRSPLRVPLIVFLAAACVFVIVTIVGMVTNASFQKMISEEESRMQTVTNEDDLTHVYNRQWMIDYLDSIPENDEYTLLLMNVDKFRDINEVYGHAFGDKVLKILASDLKEYMKYHNGKVARYGSDEFLLVFDGVHLPEYSDEIRHMRDIIHEPIEIGLANVIPTVCIGAIHATGSLSAEEAIKRAEIAAKSAKKNGPKSFAFYSSELQEFQEMGVQVKMAVKNAIKEDGFYMVYQPKISTETKEVVGYEALVRLKNEKFMPDMFIPVAEENGWLRQIGRITTEKTITQLAEWIEQGKDVKPVSINFSSVQIRDDHYLNFLLAQLGEKNVPSSLIEIEFTERTLMDHSSETLTLMQQLHSAGIRLALDDFGTGYSSLSYLHNFPTDVIKIDKSFVAQNIKSDKNRKILMDVVSLGHHIGSEIVVEGVETKEQYQYVREMNADTIQGFYFSTPLPPDEAIDFKVERKE